MPITYCHNVAVIIFCHRFRGLQQVYSPLPLKAPSLSDNVHQGGIWSGGKALKWGGV